MKIRATLPGVQIYRSLVQARSHKFAMGGLCLGVWGRSPQPPEANGGLGAKPQPLEAGGLGAKPRAAEGSGSGDGAPSAQKFCSFLQK